MNDNSKSSIRRFSIEQKRMADKLRNAEVGLKGAYNTLEDINRAYRHQENSKQRLMDQINKLKPMHQIATIHGMRTVGSPTADADKAIMLESMEHYLNLYNNDSLLRELEKKIHTSGRKLDGTISEKIKKKQALIFKNKAKTRHQKSVSTRHRNTRRLPPISEGGGSNRRKTKRKKHKRKKHKREKHKRKKRTKKRQKRRRKRRTKKYY
jgi:hypothetical protein